MKNKFMRSVTAMVVAVTMLISSQGVVTSFADGGDHSDMSESSSVQMNEVGNNGTDQSTEDAAAQCNCGVTDGKAHKEGCPLYQQTQAPSCNCGVTNGEVHKENCPLYVKPDGDNTDGNNIEDDVAQCTCDAKEVEAHKEDCPLYVKPDNGTDSKDISENNNSSIINTVPENFTHKKDDCAGTPHVDLKNSTASCYWSGSIVFVCDDCGANLTVGGENFIEGHEPHVEETPATCTTDGSKVYSCEICGKKPHTEVIEALGHDYGEDGTATECTRCGEPRADLKPGDNFKNGSLTYTLLTDTTVSVNGWDGTDEGGVLVIPETVTNSGKSYTVVMLDNGAIGSENMPKLTEITIPDTVTEIKPNALNSSNDIPPIQKKFTTINGGNGLTKIPVDAFIYQASLTTINGFSNVTEIGEQAFYQCSDLKTVGWDWTKITKIGNSAFDGCTSLDNNGEFIDLQSIEELGQAAFFTSLVNRVKFGEKLTKIPDYLFQNSWMLQEVIIPNSVETIGKNAFSMDNNTLNKVVMIGSENNSQLKRIESQAFYSEPVDDKWNPNTNYTSITINTSEDSVQIAEDAFYDQEKIVTFTVKSVETPGTTEELKNKINAANELPIVLDINYAIDTTIKIPAGEQITLQGKDGTEVVLKSTLESETMFDVPADSALILGKGIKCLVGDDKLIQSSGTFTLDGANIQGGTVDKNDGVVHIMQGGTFNMNSGSISGATINSQYSGTVLLNSGATMTMTGGCISGNSAKDQLNSSAGVTVCEGATFTMNGGEISNNTAFRGAGVLVFGGMNTSTYSLSSPATFIMENGSISGNEVRDFSDGWSSDGPRAAGGGVYVQENAEFIMNGGSISNNTSTHQGGGVATQCENGHGGIFTMNGGTISYNHAVNGGGIYSYSKTVTLNAGHIENNTAFGLGGGMYVSTNPYSIQLGKALITGNHADTMGGGIWSCPIGTIDFADGNFAVYDNTAGGAGDDVAALRKATNTITTLGSNMLGGGVMAWHKDGGINTGSLTGNEWGTVNNDPRYSEGDSRVTPPNGSQDSFSAKAIVTDDAKTLATASATLFITGNTAKQGGGIGSNGVVSLPGDSVTTDSLKVKKVWVGEGTHPDSVIVQLIKTTDGNDYVIDQVKLNAENEWTYTFTFADDGSKYSVKEIVPDGYTSSIEENDGMYTITNTKTTTPPVDPPVDPEDPTPRPGGGGDEDDDTPTIINETPVPTTTIDDEDVPLTDLPEDTVTIDDEEVPLKDIPNTGDMIPVPAMVAAVISIGGIALLMKKHK